MKTLIGIVAVLAAGAVAAPGVAWAEIGQRMSDKDVKSVFEALDHARDRFEDQLDGQLKNATIRGPRGEVNVRQALEDYQTNLKNLRERFTASNSASREALVVLEQGGAMQKFLEGYERQIKGRSEFDQLASELGRLAQAYGVTFPMAEGAAPRRYNDMEVANMASSLATKADLLKKEIEKDKGMEKADKQAVKSDLEQFKKLAGTLKSRVSGDNPATSEARQLMDMGTKIGQFVGAHQLAGNAWGSLRSGLDTLALAFGGQQASVVH